MRMPVLLHTSDEMIDTLREANVEVIIIDENFSDHEKLKDLDTKERHQFPLIVTSQAWAMRGLDYRAKKCSICLVVDQGFESQRDCDQGLARVGRLGDTCERYITYGTKPVDQAKNQQVLKTMMKFVLSLEKLTLKLCSQKNKMRNEAFFNKN